MKRWLSVRSHSKSNEQSAEKIGQPVLVYTDAQPRDDVHPFNQTPSFSTQEVNRSLSRRSFSRTRTEADRPRPASGTAESLSVQEQQSNIHTANSYNLDGWSRSTKRPSIFEKAQFADDSMIGVALGSPNHPPPQQFGILVHPLLASTEIGGHVTQGSSTEEHIAKGRGKRWKGIGALFKGKKSQPMNPPSPFYQVKMSKDHHRRSESQSKPPPPPKDRPHGDSKTIEAVTSEVNESYEPHKPGARLTTSPEEGTLFETLSYPPESADDELNNPPSTLRTQLPKLDVNLPDTQLDRYSVMFGSVLGTQEPPKSLLARRSKALEKLKTSVDERAPLNLQLSKAQDEAPLENSLPHLASCSSARRATSPAPGKSPNFSLFPHTPTTPKKIQGRLPVPGKGPMQRSFTAPGRLSPLRDDHPPRIPKPQEVKNREPIASPIHTSASTTQGVEWSTDGSAISPVSSSSSINEEEILFDIKKLSLSGNGQEAQYEMTVPDGEAVELYRSKSQKLRLAKALNKKPSPLIAQEAMLGSEPQANRDEAPDVTVEEVAAISLAPVAAPPLPPSPSLSPPPAVQLSSAQLVSPIRIEMVKPERKQPSRFPKPELSPLEETHLDSDSPSTLASPTSTEVVQNIIAMAVQETLHQMSTQGASGSASPFLDSSAGSSVISPETTTQAGAVPKNLPVSKYSLRSPPTSRSQTPTPTPTPKPVILEPSVFRATRPSVKRRARDGSPAVREARQKAAEKLVSKAKPKAKPEANLFPPRKDSKRPLPAVTLIEDDGDDDDDDDDTFAPSDTETEPLSSLDPPTPASTAELSHPPPPPPLIPTTTSSPPPPPTIPLPAPPSQPSSLPQTKPKFKPASPPKSNPHPKPTTEIAIARTISLTRKESKRLHIPKRVDPLASPIPSTLTPEETQQVLTSQDLRPVIAGIQRINSVRTGPADLAAGEGGMMKGIEGHHRGLNPIIVDGLRTHRPGKSVGVVVEEA